MRIRLVNTRLFCFALQQEVIWVVCEVVQAEILSAILPSSVSHMCRPVVSSPSTWKASNSIPKCILYFALELSASKPSTVSGNEAAVFQNCKRTVPNGENTKHFWSVGVPRQQTISCQLKEWVCKNKFSWEQRGIVEAYKKWHFFLCM